MLILTLKIFIEFMATSVLKKDAILNANIKINEENTLNFI